MTTNMTYLDLRDRQQKEIDAISRTEEHDRFWQTLNRHAAELGEAIANDKTGDGFIRDMFLYELYNHEYQYTRDLGSTLYALGYSRAWIDSDPRLKHGLDAAVAEILAA